MASPQAEFGHIDIALEIVEKFCSYRISGEEWLVLWAILRKTYGWHKKEDRISLSQFAVLTGLKRQTVLRAILKLSSKKMIGVIKNDDSGINIYSFNKDFDKWAPLSKKITVESKKIMPVIKKDNGVESKKVHTKENNTKETITKEIHTIVPHQEIVALYHKILPELPAIKEWTEFRKRILQSRWRENEERQTLEWWKLFFDSIRECDFLMGRVNEFRADLEWLIRPKNFPKVIEGKYKNRNIIGKTLAEKNIANAQAWLSGEKNEPESKT